MSRRRSAEKREIQPDSKYGDLTITKFINGLMFGGRKAVAESIFYGAFDQVQEKKNRDPKELFYEAIENVRPHLEVRSRRVGGATYQVPMDVRPGRAQALAFRWIIGMARARSETTMINRLANELMDAAENRGASVKKREDTHKMAEANKAFAHYRW